MLPACLLLVCSLECSFELLSISRWWQQQRADTLTPPPLIATLRELVAWCTSLLMVRKLVCYLLVLAGGLATLIGNSSAGSDADGEGDEPLWLLLGVAALLQVS